MDHPEIASLDEPLRSKAVETYEELVSRGHEPGDAARRATALAEEWGATRMPTGARPGTR